MKTVDLKEAKARKNGEITPTYLTENLALAAKEGRIEKIVYFSIDDDGVIRGGWSKMTTTELMGLIEIGKQQVIENIKD